MSPLSLQTRWVSSQADAQTPCDAIAVGPRGFKSALQSLLNFLIDREVRANLWLKLPKDEAWWTDVWEYGQKAAGCTIYALGKQDGLPASSSIERLAASFRGIAIEQEGDLKREYLCVAVADNFAAALLAARVPGHVPCTDKRNLKLYSTTNGGTISALSQEMKQIVEHSVAIQSQPNKATEKDNEALTMPPVSDALLASHAMLSQWSRYFSDALQVKESWPLSEAYMCWQLQFQEDLRSQLAACRSAEKNNESAALQALSSDFLSQAGQEMQAPLTTIKTALTLLGSPALKLAQRQLYLEMIATQCDRQKSIIDSVVQLLQIQSADADALQPIQLSDLIPGIVSTYQPIAEERGLMLAYTVPPNLSPVSGVESELKTVLINLLSNGIQATPKKGRVWVEASPHDAQFIALTVRDSGPGMAKSDAAKLFEPFFRQSAGQGQETGVGLGLTLAQQFVRRMGGSISVESEPAKGTTLKVLLPIYRGAERNRAYAQMNRRAHIHGADTQSSDNQRATDQQAASRHRVSHQSADGQPEEAQSEPALASSASTFARSSTGL